MRPQNQSVAFATSTSRRGTVVWIDRYWRLGDREYARSTKLLRRNSAIRRKAEEYAHRVWRRVRTKLPSGLADRLGEVARKL